MFGDMWAVSPRGSYYHSPPFKVLKGIIISCYCQISSWSVEILFVVGKAEIATRANVVISHSILTLKTIVSDGFQRPSKNNPNEYTPFDEQSI
jgi:hypothetical protein